MPTAWSFAIALILAAGAASAHDGVKHATTAEEERHETAAPATPLPFEVGGAFALVDQTGAPRTEKNPAGLPQLVFFGYANCPGICSAALPRMAEMTDLAAARGVAVTPVLITVDPARDTPAAMAAALPGWHDELVGLTGDPDALAAVRALFHVELKHLFDDPEHGPVYAHGGLIYLLDAEGRALTVIPPILSATRGAELIAKYAGAAG